MHIYLTTTISVNRMMDRSATIQWVVIVCHNYSHYHDDDDDLYFDKTSFFFY